MSVLSDYDLVRAIQAKAIYVDGLHGVEVVGGVIQPASIDLHLGDELLGFPRAETLTVPIDPQSPPVMEERGWRDAELELGSAPEGVRGGYPATGLYYPLQYGEMVLARTAERIGVGRNHVGRIEGKSTLGRLGLFVHVSAAWIDPGWGSDDPSPITLELVNLAPGPLILRPGMPIAQLTVMNLSSTAILGYGHEALGSHYAGSVGAVGAAPMRSR